MADRKRHTGVDPVVACSSSVPAKAKARQRFSGVVATTPLVKPVTQIKTTNQILIFSLLNVRKKTAAAIAGIVIAATCLWGLAMWQNISRQELLNILLATVLMIVVIAICAILLIATIKLLGKGLRKLFARDSEEES